MAKKMNPTTKAPAPAKAPAPTPMESPKAPVKSKADSAPKNGAAAALPVRKPAARKLKAAPPPVPPPVAPAAPVARAASPGKRKAVSSAAVKPRARKAKPVTQEEIALRAYFIAEKRQREGLPGDPHQDWLAAERELLGR